MVNLAWWNLLVKIAAVVLVWSLGNDLISDMGWTWQDWQWWIAGTCQGATMVAVTDEYTPRA